MSTQPGFDGSRSRSASVQEASLRLLRRGGLSADEAGNVLAYASGIHPRDGGWSLSEIQRLLFVGWMVERGLLKP